MANWTLDGFSPAKNPDRCSRPVKQKYFASVPTWNDHSLIHFAQFTGSTGTTIKGVVLESEWDFMTNSDFTSLEAKYEKTGNLSYSDAYGQAFTVFFRELTAQKVVPAARTRPANDFFSNVRAVFEIRSQP